MIQVHFLSNQTLLNQELVFTKVEVINQKDKIKFYFLDSEKSIFALNAKEARQLICYRKKDPRLAEQMSLGN